MGKRIPRIAFDIDGVLANFAQGYLDIVNRHFELDLSIDNWTDYGSHSHPSLFTAEQWKTGWQLLKSTPLFWASLSSCNDIDFKSMNASMAAFNFNGYFVTRRLDLSTTELGDANALTRIWLENRGVKSYSAVVASSGNQRLEVLRSYEIDAYLDDWDEQFLALRDSGINAYLIDRPYNQNVDTPYRVYSVQEYIDRAMTAALNVPIVHTNPTVVLADTSALKAASAINF